MKRVSSSPGSWHRVHGLEFLLGSTPGSTSRWVEIRATAEEGGYGKEITTVFLSADSPLAKLPDGPVALAGGLALVG